MNFKPGDLVMVVKPAECCGDDRAVGKLYTVTEQGRLGPPGTRLAACSKCNAFTKTRNPVALDNRFECEADRLIKIDPLTEQEKTEATEEA